MKRNRFLSALLLLSMALSLLPAGAGAADAGYTLSEDGTLTVTASDWDPGKLSAGEKERVTALYLGASASWILNDGVALADCVNLASISVDAGNPTYSAEDGVLFRDGGTILNCYPPARQGARYVLPAKVTKVTSSAFCRAADLTVYGRAEQLSSIRMYDSSYQTPPLSAEHVTAAVYYDPLSLTLSQNELTLIRNNSENTAALTAALDFGSATPGSDFLSVFDAVTWSSSDESVATVDQTGAVTAVSGGTAVITATSVGPGADDRPLTAGCAVTVLVPPVIEADASTLAGTEAAPVEADRNDGGQVLRVKLNAAATDKRVTFTSSDVSVAGLEPVGDSDDDAPGGAAAPAASLTVTADGNNVAAVRVVPQSDGAVTVTAAAAAGGQAVKFYLNFTAWVTGVTLDRSALDLAVGESASLTAAVAPENATNKAVTWESSDPSVVTADENGGLTAVGPGTATVTATTATVTAATAAQGKTASCAVRVWELTLPETLSLDVGAESTLTPTLRPATQSHSAYQWTVSDVYVARADQTGRVTARAAGTADVTVTTQIDGKTYSAVCRLTVVSIPVGALALSPTEKALPLGGTMDLTVTVAPADATERTVIWSANNANVTLSQSTSALTAVGSSATSTIRVTGAAVGPANVTATVGSSSAACAVTVVNPAQSVSLDATEVMLYLGGTEQQKKRSLTAAVTPAAATDAVTWRSTDQTVAAVDENGLVTAVGRGTARIIAAAGGKTAECAVTVKQLVTSVSLPAALTVQVGDSRSQTLAASVLPESADDPSVTWSATPAGIVSVAGGVVTGLAAGMATVRAAAQDGSGKYAECSVTVTAPAVTGVSLNETRLTGLKKGDTFQLAATVAPADAANQNVTWSVSGDAVTVDQSGLVTAAQPGNASVTVTTQDGGFTASCAVTVDTVPVSSLTLTAPGSSINCQSADPTLQITATVGPDNATDKSLTWSSSDDSVATVSGSGLVRGIRPGRVTVRATANSGVGPFREYAVTVTAAAVSAVTLNKSSLTLTKGGAGEQLAATVSPSDAWNKELVWSSADPAVATVDQNGSVTPVGKGQTAVTAASADDPTKSAVCVVDVLQPVTSISLSGSQTLTVGGSATLTAAVSPAAANNKTLAWSSGSPAVAGVDQNGRVTGISAGTAVITAAATDGSGVKKTLSVTVTATAVTSVTLSQSAWLAKPGGQKKLTAAVAPAYATDKTVLWESGDESVATVDESGLVTTHAAGTATITARSKSTPAKTAACTVTVKESVSGVVLSGAASLTVGGADAPLTVTLTPADPYDDTLNWISSDESVVTVTGSGAARSAHAVGPGTAVLTAISADSGASGSLRVTVTKNAAALTLSGTLDGLSLSDAAKHSAVLTAALDPTDASDSVVWSVEGSAVQLIDGPTVNGVSRATVVAHAGGTATVTASASSDANIKQSLSVTIATPTSGVTLNKSVLTLDKDGSETLTATVLPNTATDQTVTWTSSDPNVAAVSGGTVTGLSAGQAIITATAAGGQTAQCAVTVRPRLVTSVTLNKSGVTLRVGGSEALTATVLPDTAEDRSLVWTSSNGAVVTVENGTLTAHGLGTAVVTATAADGSGKYAGCAVTVEPTPVSAVAITTAKPLNLNLNADAAAQLAVAVSGEGGGTPTDATLRWMSSNPAVASVDENGLVTAQAAGTAAVTVWARSDDSKRDSITVRVTAPVTGVAVEGGDRSLRAGESVTLTATVSPANAGNKAVTWSSDNEDAATVDASGRVTAVAAGTARITAQSAEDNTIRGSVTVTVTAAVTGVAIQDGSGNPVSAFTLYTTGETTKQLTAAVTGGSSAVTWSSSNTGVVTVSASGLVAAAGAGVAIVSVATAEGGQSASCVVTVKKHPASVALSQSTLSLNAGDQAFLTAAVSPEDAENKAVSWESSNQSVVTVDAYGAVTAVGAGSAVVTVSTQDGGKTAQCSVTVQARLNSVSIQRDGSAAGSVQLHMLTNRSVTLTAVTDPASLPSGAAVSWTSGSSAVAAVTGSGTTCLVEGVSAGTTLVTVTVTYGGKSVSESCAVTVGSAAVRADKTRLVLLPGSPSGSVVFSDWSGDAELSIDSAAFLQTETADDAAAHTRTVTFTAAGSGAAQLRWSASPKSGTAVHTPTDGTLVVVSLMQPLTAVAAKPLSAAQGALAASLDAANRVISVSGYRTGAAPDAAWLAGKLNYTLATDVDSSLSYTETVGSATAGTLTVLCGGESVEYAIDYSGVVRLPETVNLNTTLVSATGEASRSIDLSNFSVTNQAALEAAAAQQLGTDLSGKTVTVSLALNFVSEAAAGDYKTVTLDVTPSYTVSDGENVMASGTLDKLVSGVTLTVRTAFRPALVVHSHRENDEDTVEYIVPSVTGPDGSGLYTVSWTQSSFSPVELRAARRGGYLAFDSCDGLIRTAYYDETQLGSALPAGTWVVNGRTFTALTEELLSAIDGSTAAAPVTARIAGGVPRAEYTYRRGVLTVTGGLDAGETAYAASYDARGRMTALVPVMLNTPVTVIGETVRLLRLQNAVPKAPALTVQTR